MQTMVLLYVLFLRNYNDVINIYHYNSGETGHIYRNKEKRHFFTQ